MFKRNGRGGVLAKRGGEQATGEAVGELSDAQREQSPAVPSQSAREAGIGRAPAGSGEQTPTDPRTDHPATDESEPARRGSAWTKVQFGLAALSATPLLFIGGLNGWPWDDEPAVATGPAVQADAEAAFPVAMTIPRLGVDTPLEALRPDPETNAVTLPGFGRAGWYEPGPEPGEAGRSVILARRSPQGSDPFAQLRGARAGDRIVIDTVAGTKVRFVVRAVEQFRVDQVPEGRIYGGAQKAQLRVITSAGKYDPQRGGFQRNLVIFADRVT